MAGLLATLAVMGVLMSVALPAWRQAAQREREEELIFRGKQYVRAIALFQRRYANAYPPNFDVLVEQGFLRKKYKDPMTEDGEFQVLYQVEVLQQRGAAAGQRGAASASSGPGGSSSNAGLGGRGGQASVAAPRGGVIGVVSKSTAKSIRLYNGRNYYNEWQFVYVPTTVGQGMPGGMPGAQQPGEGRGGRGMGIGGGGQRGFGPGGGRGAQPGEMMRGRGEGPGGGGRAGPATMGPGRGVTSPVGRGGRSGVQP